MVIQECTSTIVTNCCLPVAVHPSSRLKTDRVKTQLNSRNNYTEVPLNSVKWINDLQAKFADDDGWSINYSTTRSESTLEIDFVWIRVGSINWDLHYLPGVYIMSCRCRHLVFIAIFNILLLFNLHPLLLLPLQVLNRTDANWTRSRCTVIQAAMTTMRLRWTSSSV